MKRIRPSLILECESDELNEGQVKAYAKYKAECDEYQKKMNSVVTTKVTTPEPSVLSPAVLRNLANRNTTSRILIKNPAGTGSNPGFVLLDSNMIVVPKGSMAGSSIKIVDKPQTNNTIQITAPQNRLGPASTTAQMVRKTVPIEPKKNEELKTYRVVDKGQNIVSKNAGPSTLKLQQVKVAQGGGNVVKQVMVPVVNSPLQMKKSSDNTKEKDVVDLTLNEACDEKMTTISGQQEKSFPSLIVVARVHMSNRVYPTSNIVSERAALDLHVKEILGMKANEFTEHLLKIRLLRPIQYCNLHENSKLQLGVYSEGRKFPHSGGYIWVAECCPSYCTSVFEGSIFDGTEASPYVLIKVIYHWACQTSVSNVMSWVKVNALFLRNFYTRLRAVCVAAVAQHFASGKLGGMDHIVEVAVISITIPPKDGAPGSKLDVLGILEPIGKRIRLKQIDQPCDEVNEKDARKVFTSKFQRIMETLVLWVNPKSFIVTDFPVDVAICHKYGFKNVIISSPHDPPNHPTNSTISEYLRNVIPKMFQHTLPLLSRAIIQQFLDELVWREIFGPVPSKAFQSILTHIAEQTALETGAPLIKRLTKIAAFPSKNWKYENWRVNCANLSPAESQQPGPENRFKLPKPSAKQINTSMFKPSNFDGAALAATSVPSPVAAAIALEPHYYGTCHGNPQLQKTSGAFLSECAVCGQDFKSSTSLTRHLIHHAINENLWGDPSSLKDICRYCMKPVLSLKTHLAEYHANKGKNLSLMCRICNVWFTSKKDLTAHMKNVHNELDMPYDCSLCHFRTSFYELATTHFAECHSKNTAVECPYCLKIVRISNGGIDISRNQYFFVQHVQKHLVDKLNKKCEKCCLHFTHVGTLSRHQKTMHDTCRDQGVERYSDELSTLIEAPLVEPTPCAWAGFRTKQKAIAKIPVDLAEFDCVECEGPITQDHFTSMMRCEECNFRSMCSMAMKDHTTRVHFHNSSKSKVKIPVITLPTFMEKTRYCANCLFNTTNGNSMAAHLVKCGNAVCVTKKRKAQSCVDDAEVVVKREARSVERSFRKGRAGRSRDLSTGSELTD